MAPSLTDQVSGKDSTNSEGGRNAAAGPARG